MGEGWDGVVAWRASCWLCMREVRPPPTQLANSATHSPYPHTPCHPLPLPPRHSHARAGWRLTRRIGWFLLAWFAAFIGMVVVVGLSGLSPADSAAGPSLGRR